jgi:hypothetical protein
MLPKGSTIERAVARIPIKVISGLMVLKSKFCQSIGCPLISRIMPARE